VRPYWCNPSFSNPSFSSPPNSSPSFSRPQIPVTHVWMAQLHRKRVPQARSSGCKSSVPVTAECLKYMFIHITYWTVFTGSHRTIFSIFIFPFILLSLIFCYVSCSKQSRLAGTAVIVRRHLGARSAFCAVSSQRTRGPQSTTQLTYCNNPAALRASVQKLNITYLKTFESADTPATHRIRSIL